MSAGSGGEFGLDFGDDGYCYFVGGFGADVEADGGVDAEEIG